jgi:protein TonB
LQSACISQGSVTLSLQVSEQGDISDTIVEKSSGYAALDQAAARYARQHWKFQPGTRNGMPTGDWKRVMVVFNLQQVDIRY